MCKRCSTLPHSGQVQAPEAPKAQAQSSPLDITANNPANPDNQVFRKREQKQLRRRPLPDRQDFRIRIFKMRKAAGRFLGGRVEKCGCAPVPGSGSVAMVKNENGIFYRGLQRCSSVWVCPYCSYKISSYRAKQIAQITEKVIGSGGSAGMATFTISHHAYQSLEAVLTGVRSIWDKMTKHRDFKKLMKLWDRIGYVKALEVTHGEHGWHPHFHVLFWSWEDSESHREIIEGMFSIWQDVATKNGYLALEKGFSYSEVKNEAGIAEYVSKWGVAKEVAQGNIKKSGHAGGRSPFQILDEIQRATEPKPVDIALIQEYADAFKGKRQLTWSRGVKKEWLSLDDLSDEEICKKEEEGEAQLVIERKVWHQAINRDLPPILINELEAKGKAAVLKALNNSGIACQLYGNRITDSPPKILTL